MNAWLAPEPLSPAEQRSAPIFASPIPTTPHVSPAAATTVAPRLSTLARGFRPTATASKSLIVDWAEKGAHTVGALLLSLGAGQITVFKLGQAGIGLEVDPIDPVIDVLAVELGGAVDRLLEGLETRL